MSNRSDPAGSRAERMRALLIDALAPTELVIDDESAKHMHHAGGARGRRNTL